MQTMTEEQIAEFVGNLDNCRPGGLFQFRNEFDGVNVILDNGQPCPGGPYFVVQHFEDHAIYSEDKGWVFTTLAQATDFFFALVRGEIVAVLDDGSMG
jgi:hypothetical protein